MVAANRFERTEYKSNPRICPICGNDIPFQKRFAKTCSILCGRKLNGKHNHETQMVRHSSGGIRTHQGWGKQGRYHGLWCNSTWELAWIIYQEEHGIKFEKYHGYFNYVFRGVNLKYYPDFQLEDGTIVELKGYNSEQWKAKLASVPSDRKILVLYKKDMKPILEYVKKKYGNDLTILYEK